MTEPIRRCFNARESHDPSNRSRLFRGLVINTGRRVLVGGGLNDAREDGTSLSRLPTRSFSVHIATEGHVMHRLSTKPSCDVHNVLTTNFFRAQGQCSQVTRLRGKETGRKRIEYPNSKCKNRNRKSGIRKHRQGRSGIYDIGSRISLHGDIDAGRSHG